MTANEELRSGIIQLVNTIRSDSGEALANALGTLLNLSAANENRVYMGLKDLGLVPALVAVVSSDSGEALEIARVGALGVLWNLCLYYENIEYLVSYNGMSVVLAALQASLRCSESFQTSLTLLMVSGRNISAAHALVEAGGVKVISSLLDVGGVDGIKAVIILSLLLGKDESNQLSLLESKPQLGDLLESIFNNTVNGLGGDGYKFGSFDLVVIVAAIASMAVSDKNKVILSQRPRILRCLFQVLSLFLDDAPPIPYRGGIGGFGGIVGGGGQDMESAEYAIEALQLLSFVSENDADLRQHYKVIGVDILPLMKRLAIHNKLSKDAKQGAQYLRNRLEEKSVPPPAVDTIIPPEMAYKKHLMLSYAWGCRKELVVSLHEQLTSLGVEVWRDETGSSLLSKMQGATDDIMAQAIELSHTVVVCVSPHYKASANCRQEGKYTNAMYKKGQLNIIYVMMDCDYYKSVDGWLAIMLGDSLRYPLWDAQNVIQTASDIAAAVTAYQTGKDDSLRPAVGSPVTLIQQSAHSTDPHYVEAWTILTDPLKASDPEKLAAYLSELGLFKSSELVDCDEEMWNDLSSYLKPIPKRALLRILANKGPVK